MPPTKSPNCRTYTVSEAAERLGVSKAAVRRAVREGRLRALCLNQRILIPKAAVAELLGEGEGHQS